MDGGLKATRGVITKLLNTAPYDSVTNLIEKNVLGTEGKLLAGINGAKSYAQFDKALMNVSDAFETMGKVLAKNAANAKKNGPVLAAGGQSLMTPNEQLGGATPIQALMGNGITDFSKLEAAYPNASAYGPLGAVIQNAYEGIVGARTGLKEIADNATTIGALEQMKTGKTEATSNFGAAYQTLVTSNDLTELATAMATAGTIVGTYISPIFQGGSDLLLDEKDGYVPKFKKWDSGYQTLAHAKDGETSKEYPDDLASKKSGIPFAFKNMVTNSTIKAAVKKYDPKLMKELKKYSGNRLKNDSMEEFDSDITYLGKKVIPRALKVLAKVKGSAAKQLADGRAQLAEGKASYAAAPGQLEAGRQQLADGKAQLAQYEDGEQQVRDGLATLFNTEPDLELESIADRLGGDGDFDNGDNHLDIDEGLNAVEVGRGYQADDGVLITNEIMGRAVATGGLLAAGVLAVLAAILSFLKKNKAAGVFALLAAAAGAFGAFYGPAQGTYFSDIAGSTVGTLTWVAAGVLGAVALVHAIAHFAAPKNA